MGNGGVELPLFFTTTTATREGEKGSIDTLKFFDFDWAKEAEREASHLLTGVGIQHTAFSKFIVSGPKSESYLDSLTTNTLPSKIGACRLTYALTPTGHVQSEFCAPSIHPSIHTPSPR
jgi:glycine cleavage system aminomethyltransferase T